MPPLALLLPLALGTGIGLFFTFPMLDWMVAGIAMLAITPLVFWAHRRGHAPLFILTLLLSTCLLGVWRAGERVESLRAPVLASPLKAVWATGIVTAIEPKENGFRLLLTDVGLDGLEPADTPRFIRITTKKLPEALAIGDAIRARAMLYPPSPPVLPGAFNFARHAYFQQLGAVGYAITPVTLQGGTQEEIPADAAHKLEQLRISLAARITRALPPAEGAIASALIVGEQGAIPSDVRESLQHAGLSHILSVSGLHMALVTGFIFLLIRRLLAFWPYAVLHWPLKKIAAAVAILAAGFYLALAGAPVPAQRSFLMLALVLLAVMLDRTAHPLRLVALAALAVLLWAPESLLTASFQLSFAATAALVAYYEWRRDRLQTHIREHDRALWQRPFLYLRETAAASLVAAFATAPYSLYHFGNASISGILANMLALPLTGFATMPAGIFTLLAMPLGLEALPLHAMGWSLSALLWIARITNETLGWIIQLPSPPLWVLVAVTGMGCMLLLLRHRLRWALLPLMLGSWWAGSYATPQPLLLTEERYTAIALPGDRWLLLGSHADKGNWVTEQWQQRLGIRFMSKEDALRAGDMLCDPGGCVVQAALGSVAVPDTADALTEDCTRARVVVTDQPVENCTAFPVPSGAVQALYAEKDALKLWKAEEAYSFVSPSKVVSVLDLNSRR